MDWQRKRFMAMYVVNNCADYVFRAKIINEGNFYIYFFLAVFLFLKFVICLFNFGKVLVT